MDKQLKIIHKRWPLLYKELEKHTIDAEIICEKYGSNLSLLVDGIHLSSVIDPDKEAKQQSSLISQDAEQIWLYGLANHNLALYLLSNNTLKELNIVIFDLLTFFHVLHFFPMEKILSDERVNISYVDESMTLMFPFVANPACLRLSSDSGYKLRDQIILELSTPYLNRIFKEKQQEHLKQITENLCKLKEDKDISLLINNKTPAHIAIVAAGPSLSETLDIIKAKRPGYFVIAVLRVAEKLRLEGIIPDIVVGIDPNLDAMYAITKEINHNEFKKIPLVYFPIVPNAVLKLWKGPRYKAFGTEKYYQDLPGYNKLIVLPSYGSVIHAALSLAIKFSPKAISFFGADFSFPNSRSHIENTFNVQSIDYKPAVHSYVINGFDEKVVTTNALRGYLRDLERIIKSNNQIRYFNMSRSGAFIQGCTYLESSL